MATWLLFNSSCNVFNALRCILSILSWRKIAVAQQACVRVVFLSFFCMSFSQASEPVEQSYRFDLPKQELINTLNNLADKFDFSLLYNPADIRGEIVNPLSGKYTLKAALSDLLNGTSLDFVVTERGVIVVTVAPKTQQISSEKEDLMIDKKKTLTALALAGLLQGSGALAQNTDSEAEQGKIREEFEEIVVTGRAGGGSQITKFESSNSITTFSEDTLREIAPLAVSDVWAEVPGVWAETSGGQAGNNVFVRGLPAPGQLLFSKINVDGLPLIEEHGIFAPPDGLIKLDETIKRVETIRGGSSSVFASNAPGGVFNHIVKKGTQDFEGIAKLEVGDFGHVRGDLFFAGPIDDKTTYAVGGFFRESDGVRDPGNFSADSGGSIRGTITRELDRGEISVSANYVDDKNIFYLPFQLGQEANGDLTSLPGFDANFDTNISDDSRFVSFLQPGGQTQDFDLADGIHSDILNISTDFSYEFENGWSISNKSRISDGTIDLNTLIITGDIQDGQTFLDGQLARAQSEFAGTDRLSLRFLQDGVGAASTFEFGNITGAGDLATATFDGGNAGNGLVGQSGFFSFVSEFENIFNEFQLSKAFEFNGTHNLTFGSYISLYSYDQTEQISNFIHEFAGSPRVLDVFAVDAADNVVGSVTQNGFIEFGDSFQNYEADGDIFAFYISDEWEINDRLRIDAGIRYETQSFDGVVEGVGEFDLSAANPFIAANGLQTLADDTVTFGNGNLIEFSESYDEVAYSIGANYEISDSISTYLRYSDGFRTPSVDQQAQAALSNGGDVSSLPVNDLVQIEGGFKLKYNNFSAFITAFYTDFSDQVFSDPVTDAAGNLVNVQALLSAETTGIEAEIDLDVTSHFSINAKATLQTPELSDFAFAGSESVGLTGSSLSSLAGNIVPRIPETVLTLRPQYSFSGRNYDASIFLDVYYVGNRFSDFTNALVIPAYTTFSLGATVDIGERFQFTAIIDNLDNEIGLTEGNPRGDLFGAGGGTSIATFGRPIVGRNARISFGYKF